MGTTSGFLGKTNCGKQDVAPALSAEVMGSDHGSRDRDDEHRDHGERSYRVIKSLELVCPDFQNCSTQFHIMRHFTNQTTILDRHFCLNITTPCCPFDAVNLRLRPTN